MTDSAFLAIFGTAAEQDAARDARILAQIRAEDDAADADDMAHPNSDPPECGKCGSKMWGVHLQCNSEGGYYR